MSATFGPGSYWLTAVVVGRGRVTSLPSGLSCSQACSHAFPYGKTVALSAQPATGWKFLGWNGSCHGTDGCRVRVTGASLVRAVFRRA